MLARLLVGLVCSSIGIGYLIYAKRQGEVLGLAIGALLVLLSFFVTNPLALGLSAASLIIGSWILKNYL